MEDRRPAAYAAEFVGTFGLVLFIGLVLTVQGPGALKTSDFAVIGLVHVFTLASLIAALGGTSGAHFNPAVTGVMTVLRKIKPADAVIYVVMQLAGAVCAALVVKLILDVPGAAVNYGATSVNLSLLSNDSGAFLAEIIGTAVLVFAIMGTAVNARANGAWAPWIIGGTLGMAVMCIGPLTGAGFNPARAFGPALVSGEWGGAGTFLYVYVAGPIVGAIVAGIGYTKLVLEPQERAFGGRLVDTDIPAGNVPGAAEAAAAGPGERPIDKLS